MPNFPARQFDIQHQRGFSLIEALFSALILGIALLGLAGFHAVALQDGSLVKARSVAANLAQEKLDDLRGFTRLEGDATACGNGTFCFSEIADNAGGREVGSNLVLPSGTRSEYTDNYSLAWTVTCSTEAPGTAPSFGGTCTDAAAKMVTVTTTWNDSRGVEQSVTLQSVIYGLDPSRMALAAGPAFSNQLPKKPAYTPVGVPDAVPVPINTGGTQFKESSKPLPTVAQGTNGIEVSFDSVVYSRVDGGYEKDSQEEFSTVTCECQFDGTAEARTPTRKIWNGSTLVTQVGEKVTKVAGEPQGNSPPAHCDICCRDHHDRSDTADAKYDPQRPSDDYTSGDHNHYWYSSCVNGTVGSTNCNDNSKIDSLALASPFVQVTSGAYLESCRVGRVNGYWRVMQDWRLRKVTILPYDFLTTDANLTSYVDLVEKVVENAVRTDSGAAGVSLPTLSGRNLTLASGDDPVQMLSRAVYVDTIYGKDAPNTIDSDYYTALLAKLAASPNDSAWLDYAPFYEANLTLLYDWSSSDTAIATVSSEPIQTIVDPANGYYGNYSRGNVIIQAGTTPGVSSITARARLSNSGVTGGVDRNLDGESFGTDVHDNLGSETLADTITVTRTSSDMHLVYGKVVNGGTAPVDLDETSSPIRVTLNTTAGEVISACSAQVDNTALGGWYYSCTVSNDWKGTLSFTSVGSVYTFSYLGSVATTTYTTKEIPAGTSNLEWGDVTAYGPLP